VKRSGKRLGTFPRQFQCISIQIGAQAEPMGNHIVDVGLHGGDQAGWLGVQQNPQGAYDLQPHLLGQLTSSKIIQAGYAIVLSACLGDDGSFTCSQAVGGQILHHGLRYRYWVCPGQTARVDGIGMQ